MSAASLRSSKRRRRRPPYYHSATAAEERLLQHAIQNSKLDRSRPADGRLNVPFAPTFFPTVEDFEGNPIDYINKIRPIAEKYGIAKIVPPKGWNPTPFGTLSLMGLAALLSRVRQRLACPHVFLCTNWAAICSRCVVFSSSLRRHLYSQMTSHVHRLGIDFDSTEKFQTKLQYLHRLQEGISFGDGVEYSAREYQAVASRRATEWKGTHYPNHDLLSRHPDAFEGDNGAGKASGDDASDGRRNAKYSPENLERDYWNIVETHSREVAVEYGNDVDTSVFGSGFPFSERGRSVNGTADPEKMKLPEPEFGSEDYYKETWWNLNNIPGAPDSVLRYIQVGINGM